MTIGPCTADDVQKAMQRFDLEMRDTLEWRQWEGDKNHKFAFVSNDHWHLSELSVHRELEIVGADNSAGMKRKDCFDDALQKLACIRFPNWEQGGKRHFPETIGTPLMDLSVSISTTCQKSLRR